MDYSIDRMLKENYVLPMQVWYSLKQYNDNLKKFAALIADLSHNNTSNTTNAHLSIDHLVIELIKCNITNEINSLIRLLKNTSSLTGNEMDKSKHYDNLELLLNNFINKNSTNKEKCIETILIAYFYIFSEQFSQYFEKNPILRKILADRNDIVNKTLSSFIKINTNNSFVEFNVSTLADQHFLKIPLRNLEPLYKRYQQQSKFYNKTLKLCNEQPPILCNHL